jgi:hypothetical protein
VNTERRKVGLGLGEWAKRGVALVAALLVYGAAQIGTRVAGHPATFAGVAVLLIGLVLAGLWGAKALALVAALLGVAGYANLNFLTNALPPGPQPPGALVRCPSLKLNTGWAGQIDDQVGPTGAFAFLGPSIYARGTHRYPRGCVLDFDGYCVGDALRDRRSALPNTVWYRRRGEFFPGAAVTPILTHRTKAIARRDCAGGAPAPMTPAFVGPSAATVSGVVKLAAVAPYAEIVGFAAYFDNVSGNARSGSWHRLGVDPSSSGGFHLAWDTLSALGRDQSAATTVTVMAVPCLALDFPGKVQTTRDYRVVRHVGAQATIASAPEGTPALTAAQRTTARREACRDPQG